MKRIILILSFFLSFQLFGSPPQKNDLQDSILQARNRVMPALVHIEPVRSYFTTGEKRHTLVTGSGFIFSKDGHVLTNHHVVENAEKVHCTLSNKKKLSAKVVGSDPSTDVAVLKLDISDVDIDSLPYCQLGNSDSLEVGQIVLALGSPLGLSRSVSMGVISSIDRYFGDQGEMISPYNLWIQTDAAINPGNSGGPLINLNGKVVGINARGVFMAENLGFAIPINLAEEVANKLLAGKKIRRSWIGVEMQPIKKYRDYLDKPGLRGLLVGNIEPLSPAKKVDLKPGDVILSINDHRVNADFDEDLPAIRKIIADLPRQEQVSLKIWRNGDIQTIQLTTHLEPFEYLPEFECEQWGLVVKSITRNIFQIHDLEDYDGVYVSAVKSGEIAKKAGLQAGDIIRSVNHNKVRDLEEFKELYQDLTESDHSFIFFEVLRQGAHYFAAMDMSQSAKKPAEE